MSKHLSIYHRAFAFMLLLLCASTPLFAQEADEDVPLQPASPQPMLPKDGNGYFIISSDEDYETFRQIVETGNPYANAILTADVSTTKTISTSSREWAYRGTFDGQGHTITLHNTNGYGVFGYTFPGCVIRNLKVSGTVECLESNEWASSIVYLATFTRIENCISDVTFTSSAKHIGGIANATRGECFIENCAFIGTMPSTTRSCGLVCENQQSLSIKSCYVAPTYNNTGSGTGMVFVNTTDDLQTNLNNYYCNQCVDAGLSTDGQKGQSISMDDIRSGKLCYRLNMGGKKGLMWYQHGDFPYPFKGTDGKVVMSTDNGYYNFTAQDRCDYATTSGYCTYCGDVREADMLPLEQGGETTINVSTNYEGELWVDNIKYHVDVYKKTATVLGLYPTDADDISKIKAIYIPETVKTFRYGNVCTVEKIADNAFKDNKTLQYCYIPSTVKEVGVNAFYGCNKISFLHIADGEETLNTHHDAFYYCPATTLHIGRNLAWESDLFGPFTYNVIDYLFIGPRVTRFGNMNQSSDFWDSSLATYTKTVTKTIFLGDEESLNSTIEIIAYARNVRECTNFYINRNIKKDHLSGKKSGLTISEQGMFDYVRTATFGPFVKTIPEKAFSAEGEIFVPNKVNSYTNKIFHTLNVTNAFNLEHIGRMAFWNCGDWKQSIVDFSNTKLKTIDEEAFGHCDKVKAFALGNHITTIGKNAFTSCLGIDGFTISSTVTTIGPRAFSDCNNLSRVHFEYSPVELDLSDEQFDATNISDCYIDRNFTLSSNGLYAKGGCYWVIGPNVTRLNKALFTNEKYSSIYFDYSDTPLHFDDYIETGIETMTINRKIIVDKVNREILPFRKGFYTTAIDLGESITYIPESMFYGYTGLKCTIIPPRIKSIGRYAFAGCSGLEVVSIMGNTDIGYQAFDRCSGLQYLYLLNDSINVGDQAFYACKNLKEISTPFTKDPYGQSGYTVFSDETYENAYLSTADDEHVVFTKAPWKFFKKIGTLSYTSTFKGTEETESGVYERASSAHPFPKGKYDLLYLPFDMDSYFFGSDAEVYRLMENYDGTNYKEKLESTGASDSYETDKLAFLKVNLDEQPVLSKGAVYLVKTNHDVNTISSYFSLYDGQGITVNSSPKSLAGRYNASALHGSQGENSLMDNTDTYVMDEGVLKLVNGDYVTSPYGVYLQANGDGQKQMVFTLYEDEDDEDDIDITTSKSDLSFSKYLEGYSSFYAADYNYIAPEWCEVYVVTGTDNGVIDMEQIDDNVITKGQAVLLKSSRDLDNGITEYLTYTTHGSTATALYDSNLLKGVSVDTPARELSPERGFVYVLSCNSAYQNTGFYKLSGDRLMPAGKAYLDPDGLSPEQLAKACLFVFGDNVATGIRQHSTANPDDAMQRIYDTMGRRLRDAGYKGIYIIDNKKVFK